MDIKEYQRIAHESIDELIGSKWEGKDVIGVHVEPIYKQNFGPADEVDVPEEAPWEAEEELPEREESQAEEDMHLVNAMGYLEEIIARTQEVICMGECSVEEHVVLMEEAGKMGKLMLDIHRAVSAWK